MKRLLLSLFIILFSGSIVFGLSATISSVHVILELASTDTISETIIFKATNPYNETSDSVYVLLNDAPFRMEISDGVNRLTNFSVFLANGIYTVRIYDPITSNNSKEISLTFVNNKIVESIENYYLMSYSFKSFYTVSDFYLEAKLPSGYGITKKSGGSVSPQPSSLYSDGQQIILKWAEPVNYGETDTYILFFEKLSEPNVPFEGFIISGFVGLTAGFVLSQITSRRKRREIVAMALSTDEKKVVDLIFSRFLILPFLF